MSLPQPLPHGLATMSPGPELAAALASVSPESVSGFDSVTFARAAQVQENAATALKMRAVVEVALRGPGDWNQVSRLQIPHQFAADEVAAMYGLSTTARPRRRPCRWTRPGRSAG